MYFLLFLYIYVHWIKSHILKFRFAVAIDQFLIIFQNMLLYFLIPAGTAQKLTLKVPLLVVFLFFLFIFSLKL